MRYIRFNTEKQQYNLLNCNNINQWKDTCYTRATDFINVCTKDEYHCGCDIIQDETPTRWVNGTVCDRYDKYSAEIQEIYMNNTWSPTGNERNKVLIEANSADCGYKEPDLIFEYDTTISPTLAFAIYVNNKPQVFKATESPYSDAIFNLIGYNYLPSARGVFNRKEALTKIIKFPNTSYCEEFYEMLNGCVNLTYFDASAIDTRSATNFSMMFNGCSGLTEINCTNWNTSNVETVSNMFYGCSSLTEINCTNWNTSNLEIASSMFARCSGLTSLDLSGWDTRKLTFLASMFNRCTNLREINLSNWDLASYQGTTQTNVFGSCTSLKTIIMDNCSCETIAKIPRLIEFSQLPADQITIISNTGCPGTVPHPSGDELAFEYDNSVNSNLEYTLNDVKYTATTTPYSTTLAYLGIDTLTSCKGTFFNTNLTKLIKFPNIKGVNTMHNMFKNCTKLTSLDLSSFNTSNVIDLCGCFYGCSSLESIDLSNWNTQNVTEMGYLFTNCKSISNIDLSSFNVSKVMRLNKMFTGCSSLVSIDLSNWSLPTNNPYTNGMFANCIKLKRIYMRNCPQDTIDEIKYELKSGLWGQTVEIITQ